MYQSCHSNLRRLSQKFPQLDKLQVSHYTPRFDGNFQVIVPEVGISLGVRKNGKHKQRKLRYMNNIIECIKHECVN